MEESRKQRSVYSVEVARRESDGWRTERISPNWVHALHEGDAVVQAFDRYLEQSGESVALLARSEAEGLQILVRPQGLTSRWAVFPLHSIMEHRVRRDVAQRDGAQKRLDRATRALKESVREAAAVGVRQSRLVQISGWSRETLRKLSLKSL